MLEHKHFIVDCYVNKPLCDVDKTIAFLKSAVEALDMKIAVGPISAYCDADNNEGITLIGD